MERITVYRTSDGKDHESEERARTHAERRYGNMVTALAHEIARTDKYTDACEWVGKNLPRFRQLLDLELDRHLPVDDEADN